MRAGKQNRRASRLGSYRSRRRSRLWSRLVGLALGIAVLAGPALWDRYAGTVTDLSLQPTGGKGDGEQQVTLVGLMRPMPICGGGRRVTCVVDGDTFWIDGEKVRIESIDAPEINGSCQRERELARSATERLSEILGSRNFRLERHGKDKYGRTLALVKTSAGEAGEILVREGLAQRWAGRKAQWCGQDLSH